MGMSETLRITMLGDSLTAGFGLTPEQALPARLQQALCAAGIDVVIQNAGVSGNTTEDGLARLGTIIDQRPDIVLLGLGANDALRGIAPEVTAYNLHAIITALREAGIRVILLGMYAPPQAGRDYGRAFKRLFTALAAQHDLPLYGFLLGGVALRPHLNLEDGKHPNADGVLKMVSRLTPFLARRLKAN